MKWTEITKKVITLKFAVNSQNHKAWSRESPTYIIIQVNLERKYRDCIKSRRDKIGITRHIMMHQVLYNNK